MELFTKCRFDFKYLGSLVFANDAGRDGEVVCGM